MSSSSSSSSTTTTATAFNSLDKKGRQWFATMGVSMTDIYGIDTSPTCINLQTTDATKILLKRIDDEAVPRNNAYEQFLHRKIERLQKELIEKEKENIVLRTNQDNMEYFLSNMF